MGPGGQRGEAGARACGLSAARAEAGGGGSARWKLGRGSLAGLGREREKEKEAAATGRLGRGKEGEEGSWAGPPGKAGPRLEVNWATGRGRRRERVGPVCWVLGWVLFYFFLLSISIFLFQTLLKSN